MKEYEYNFMVKSLEPYIKYCKENNYEEKILEQKRIVYESKYDDNLLARITTNNKTQTILDFKNVKENDKLLKISQESLPINVNEDNHKHILSILETLNFKKVSTITRKRYIYKKNNVIFEIDDYIRPQMKVVAIEGNKEDVDNVYEEVKGYEQKS